MPRLLPLILAAALAGCGHPSAPATRPASRPTTAPTSAPATQPVPLVTTAPASPLTLSPTPAGVTVAYAGETVLTGTATPFTSDPPTVTATSTPTGVHTVATSTTGQVVTTDYAVSGPDLTATVTIANGSPSPIPATVDLYTETLPGTPDPAVSTVDWSNGYGYPSSGRLWPSVATPIVGAEAATPTLRTLTYCRETLAARVPHALRPDVCDDAGPRPSWRWQLYDPAETVPAGGTLTRTVVTQFAATADVPTLWSGYKAALPPIPETAGDTRPAVAENNLDAQHVTPADPLGYNDDGGATLWRRPDLVAGAAAIGPYFGRQFGGHVGAVYYWNIGGMSDPMYADDVRPNLANIAGTLPTITAGMTAAGIEPRDTLRLDAPGTDADFEAQADYLVARGFTGAYCDSGGATRASLARLDAIARTHPSFVTAPEYACELMPTHVAYCEWTGAGTRWLSEHRRAVLTYLRSTPGNPVGVTWLCVDRSGTLNTPADYAAHGLTPLVDDKSTMLGTIPTTRPN